MTRHSDTVRRLVELLRLERDRPPEFRDGGVSAAAWLEPGPSEPSRRSSARATPTCGRNSAGREETTNDAERREHVVVLPTPI